MERSTVMSITKADAWGGDLRDIGAREEMIRQLERGTTDLLWAVADFLVRSGVERKHVAQALLGIASSVADSLDAPEWCGGSGELLSLASESYSLWWQSPEYLDEHGLPRGLPEKGEAPSVQSLLATRFSGHEIDAALEILRRSPSISIDSGGTWYAKDAALLIPSSAALSMQRLTGVLRGLLSTFHANNLANAPGDGLFERTVLSCSLPENHVPVIKRVAHQHLSQTLLALHRVIENAETRLGPRAEKEVGIEIFMYELPKRAAGQTL